MRELNLAASLANYDIYAKSLLVSFPKLCMAQLNAWRKAYLFIRYKASFIEVVTESDHQSRVKQVAEHEEALLKLPVCPPTVYLEPPVMSEEMDVAED